MFALWRVCGHVAAHVWEKKSGGDSMHRMSVHTVSPATTAYNQHRLHCALTANPERSRTSSDYIDLASEMQLAGDVDDNRCGCPWDLLQICN